MPRALPSLSPLPELQGYDDPEELVPLEVKKAVMALSAMAMLAVFVTMYVISAGADDRARGADAPLVEASPQRD